MNTAGKTSVRAAVRYPMELEAVVRSMSSAGGERSRGVAVRTRDMSSRGVSFYTAARWYSGEAVAMLIEFGGDVVSPFSYTLKVEGRVVRSGTDEASGRTYHAVEFDGPGRILHWRERSPAC